MTTIYFVRHAQPDFTWEEDRTRPLTAEGLADSERVYEALANVPLDYAISSPYVRSMDTIRRCAEDHHLEIHTDERFRERESGRGGNVQGMFQKRWADFDFHEEGGESIGMVQKRNMEGLFHLLDEHPDEVIVFGTHGTALSTILNYFDPEYNCDSFLRIIDFMPYMIRLDFEGRKCVGKEEILIVEKAYVERAPKNRG